VAKAIRYAAKNGAHVINLSLGFGEDSKDVRAAIDFAIKRNVVVVASAGNSNSTQAQFPAALPNVIGVAASDFYDHKAAFSNYGSSVFVTAPGVAIITAYPNGYAVASGTSFSSPIVAAEAALIRSLTVNGIAGTVETSVVNIDSLNSSFAGLLGSGRVDLWTAVSNAAGK
jgi:subtilisin family serine protease